MHAMGWRRDSAGASVGRLIAELESEFDLLRLERYMSDLERKDERLTEEIDALRARIEEPALEPRAPMRRWWRTLATESKVLWLKSRRERLAEEWRRCSAMAAEIRFGLRVTRRSARE